MKFYLSSYGIGNQAEKLKLLIGDNKKAVFIGNALDTMENLKRKNEKIQEGIKELEEIELEVEELDLKDYFGEKEKLEKKLSEFGTVWVRGGHIFTLRKAYFLSGFDEILKKWYREKKDILYGGFSAGVCILAPSLRGLELVDDISLKAEYDHKVELIWDGLGILDYEIAPHYKSPGHPETENIDKVVNYYKKNKTPFKALRDGEVIIIE